MKRLSFLAPVACLALFGFGGLPTPQVGAILVDIGYGEAHVGNNTALAAFRPGLIAGMASATTPTTVHRDGFTTAGDGGGGRYLYSTSACVAADGGTQVASAMGGCWMLDAAADISPQMFGARGDGTAGTLVNGLTQDDRAFDAAVAAATRLGKRLRIPAATYCKNETLTLIQAVVPDADKAAVINNCGSGSLGILLQPGNYGGWFHAQLPSLGNWPKALQLSGASNVHAAMGYIGGSSDTAVQMVSTGGSILDSIIQLDNIFSSGRGYVITGLSGGDVIQGNGVQINFVTNTGKVFGYTGVPCSEDGNFFEAFAVDITSSYGGGYAVGNETGGSIPRARFVVSDWFGGEGFGTGATGGATQLVKGNFAGLVFNVKSTRNWLKANYAQNGLAVLASEITLHARGPFTTGPVVADNAQNAANFNGAQPIASDSFAVQYVLDTQDMQPNEIRDFFVYVLFPDSYTQPWSIRQTQSFGGLNILGVSDESGTVEGRLRVRVQNSSGAAIPLKPNGATNPSTSFTFVMSRF